MFFFGQRCLDSAKDVRVEVDEGHHRDQPRGDQPGPVDVEPIEMPRYILGLEN